MEPPGSKLSNNEIFWRDHYDWLLESGYLLRPRYKPGWEPSWKGKKGISLKYEDGWRALVLSPTMYLATY